MIFPYDEKETSNIMINVAKLQFFFLFVFDSEINFCVVSCLYQCSSNQSGFWSQTRLEETRFGWS